MRGGGYLTWNDVDEDSGERPSSLPDVIGILIRAAMVAGAGRDRRGARALAMAFLVDLPRGKELRGAALRRGPELFSAILMVATVVGAGLTMLAINDGNGPAGLLFTPLSTTDPAFLPFFDLPVAGAGAGEWVPVLNRFDGESDGME